MPPPARPTPPEFDADKWGCIGVIIVVVIATLTTSAIEIIKVLK